jgi:hypothetical protein
VLHCTFYYIENINRYGLLVKLAFVVNEGKSELNSCNSSVKKSLRCVTKLNYAFIFKHFAQETMRGIFHLYKFPADQKQPEMKMAELRFYC